MLVLAVMVAVLASVDVMLTEPVLAVAFKESVEMLPVEEMLVSALRVTLSVAVSEPELETSAVVEVRAMSVAETEPVLLKVPDEVTSKVVPAVLEPSRVAEPPVTSALT
jgi:hypothetical protein